MDGRSPIWSRKIVLPQLEMREEMITSGWREVFLNREQAASCSYAESVKCGHSIIVVHRLATSDEVLTLKSDAARAASAERAHILKQNDLDFQQRIVALRTACIAAANRTYNSCLPLISILVCAWPLRPGRRPAMADNHGHPRCCH